ncbi:hypothetical protein [Nocardia takedensis]|uniref:hypothetical protein n=1 Tax=Nocardia takedensis TaxID=259390 RepID=UPI0002E2C8B4|nr:hypothetical protein [Nocardia takedensis]
MRDRDTPDEPIDDAHGKGWLEDFEAAHTLRLVPPDPDPDPDLDTVETGGEPFAEFDFDSDPDPAGRWLTPVPDLPDDPVVGERTGLSWRGWGALVSVVAIMAGVVGAWASDSRRGETLGATAESSVQSTPTMTGHGGACEGLEGTVVTNGPGDPATVVGVFANFQAAYYARDVDAALRVLDPAMGITHDSLAAGIAKIPVGTIYCAAVTPLPDGTANTHVAHLTPDGVREDFLGIVNSRPGETGPLITRFQDRGK